MAHLLLRALRFVQPYFNNRTLTISQCVPDQSKIFLYTFCSVNYLQTAFSIAQLTFRVCTGTLLLPALKAQEHTLSLGQRWQKGLVRPSPKYRRLQKGGRR